MESEKEKKAVDLREKTFEEIIQLFYNNPKEQITTGLLITIFNKFERRIIEEYGLKNIHEKNNKE